LVCVCGIVGYVGSQRAVDVVLDGLRRMEYRGYDSAGVGLLEPEGLVVHRKAGKLANLEAELASVTTTATAGLGHTRWATHGAPTDANAHPHRDELGSIALVHNGIIENYAALKAELADTGVVFTSETDTEVAAHLLAAAFRDAGDLTEAMRQVCQRLEGAFTLVAASAGQPGAIVAARRDSPLVVGLGEGETFLASDVTAFIAHTRRAMEIGQDQVVTITLDGAQVIDLAGNEVAAKEWTVDWDAEAAEKAGFPYFMLKEIQEQPRALADTLLGRIDAEGGVILDELRLRTSDFRRVDKVFIVACGSAFHAGLIAKYAIEHWCRLPCEVEVSSEFRYRDPVLDSDTLVLAISQSGETADTLQAVAHAREQKARVVAITNTVGSTLARASDAVLYTRAGPEIGVAATKTFLTQIAATYLVGLYLAEARGVKLPDEVEDVVRQLESLPEQVRSVLDTVEPVRALAKKLAIEGVPQVLFIGRHVAYPMALEGALKLMELSYLPAQGFAAGELKHGPIARIDHGTPVVVIALERDRLYDKVLSNIQEVRARGARVIAVAVEGDSRIASYADEVIRVPRTSVLLSPLVTAVPLQVLACELALALGLDVDKPRNLAKSVTVE
jgi:glucosamine--fructose-6-phosphate aminotransferase (isomerizing)